jgi:hypothetical protein
LQLIRLNVIFSEISMKENCRGIRSARVSYFSIVLVLVGWLLSPLTVVGNQFSQVRNSLLSDLAAVNDGQANRLAIVYHVPEQEQVKARYNLVQLKRDLSYELVKSFAVADPVTVQEIFDRNQLTYRQLRDDDHILKQFADRADSTRLLFVELRLRQDRLMADMQLVNRERRVISQLQMEIKPEAAATVVAQPATTTTTDRSRLQRSQPSKTVIQSFNTNFAPKSFLPDQNDSWLFLSPTALIQPKMFGVEMLLWLKHLGEVDIRPVRMRLDMRVIERLQFGLQLYGISERPEAEIPVSNLRHEQGVHSLYASVKYQVADEDDLPFALSLGMRRRLYWDENNTDFINSTPDINDKNDRYNQITLQGALTGRIDAVGLLYSLYLDSQALSAGAKFLLTPEVKLCAEAVGYHHEKPQVPGDFAAGIQLYNPLGMVSLSYQLATEQAQLGLLFDF